MMFMIKCVSSGVDDFVSNGAVNLVSSSIDHLVFSVKYQVMLSI